MAQDSSNSTNTDQSQPGDTTAINAASNTKPVDATTALNGNPSERADGKPAAVFSNRVDANGHTRDQHRAASAKADEPNATKAPTSGRPDSPDNPADPSENRADDDAQPAKGTTLKAAGGAAGEVAKDGPGGATIGEGLNLTDNTAGEVGGAVLPFASLAASVAESIKHGGIGYAMQQAKNLSSTPEPVARPEHVAVSLELPGTGQDVDTQVDTPAEGGWLDGGVQSDIAGQAIVPGSEACAVPAEGEADFTFAEFVGVSDGTPTARADGHTPTTGDSTPGGDRSTALANQNPSRDVSDLEPGARPLADARTAAAVHHDKEAADTSGLSTDPDPGSPSAPSGSGLPTGPPPPDGPPPPPDGPSENSTPDGTELPSVEGARTHWQNATEAEGDEADASKVGGVPIVEGFTSDPTDLDFSDFAEP